MSHVTLNTIRSCVQMGSKIGGDILVWDFQRREIGLGAGAKVKYEFIAIAEFDQPGTIGLATTYERTPSTEGD